MEVASDAGQELCNEIINRCGGQTNGIALGIGGEMCLLAGHIEIGDRDVGNWAEQRGVVERPSAVVGPLPYDLADAVQNPARDAEVGPAVIVRVSVSDSRNEESADELAGHVLGKTDAHVFTPSAEAGAVNGVRVGCDRNTCHAKDCHQVEWIGDIDHGEPRLFLRRHRFDLRPCGEACIPIDELRVFYTDRCSNRLLACRSRRSMDASRCDRADGARIRHRRADILEIARIQRLRSLCRFRLRCRRVRRRLRCLRSVGWRARHLRRRRLLVWIIIGASLAKNHGHHQSKERRAEKQRSVRAQKVAPEICCQKMKVATRQYLAPR